MKLWTALLILVAVAGFVYLDVTVLHWDLHIFLGKQLMRVIGWLSFWR